MTVTLMTIQFNVYESLDIVRTISKGSVSCFALQSATVSAVFYTGPEEYGGLGEIHEKVESACAFAKDEAERNKMLDEVRSNQGLDVLVAERMHADLLQKGGENCAITRNAARARLGALSTKG